MKQGLPLYMTSLRQYDWDGIIKDAFNKPLLLKIGRDIATTNPQGEWRQTLKRQVKAMGYDLASGSLGMYFVIQVHRPGMKLRFNQKTIRELIDAEYEAKAAESLNLEDQESDSLPRSETSERLLGVGQTYAWRGEQVVLTRLLSQTAFIQFTDGRVKVINKGELS